jgi:hypothetical protein
LKTRLKNDEKIKHSNANFINLNEDNANKSNPFQRIKGRGKECRSNK